MGFRATTELLARKLSLKGHVKNCPDGTVEVVAQGQKESLETLISKLKAAFHVEQVDVHYVYTNELKSWFLAAPDIRIFEAASIVQLIQVELLRRRFAASNLRRRLCQIPNF